jgi:hypothetical protein
MYRFNNLPVGGSEPYFIARGIQARILILENNRFELVIVIDENTQSSLYRKAWTNIDQQRFALLKYQGTDLSTLSGIDQAYNNRFIYEYNKLVERGISYRMIANDINFDLSVHLTFWAIKKKEIDPEEVFDGLTGLFRFYKLCEIFRVKDCESWINPGLSEIDEGRAPWTPESGPVSKQNVIDTIKQWRKNLADGKVVIVPPSEAPVDDKIIQQSLIDQVRNGSQFKVVRLLLDTFPDSWEKYQNRLVDRLQYIIEYSKELYMDL